MQMVVIPLISTGVRQVNRTNRPYWIALMAGAGVGLLAAVLIYACRERPRNLAVGP
jgi:hypothetical protein